MNKPESDPDRVQQLADRLAQLHDRMIGTGTDEAIEWESELQPEQDVLQLIERVRRTGVELGWSQSNPPTHTEGDLSTRVDGEARRRESRVDLALPKTIGRFEIIGLLGQGGYGIVYHAIDPELDRHVAIKIPRPETLLTADLRARFLREGKIAAALSHPGIVTIHETGQDQALCFIVCELVAGITLADWLAGQSGPLDPRGVAELVAALAGAVQHAHSRGVLHRDLKPANVLVQCDQGHRASAGELAGSVKISDFGLARFEMEGLGTTRSGSMIGTPGYMAPEQMGEFSGELGPEADIYSLGCIFYELLAGRRPFEEVGVLQMIQAVNTKAVPPLRQFHKGLSRDLEAICMKCLEKRAANRYDSAHALSEDLNRWLSGQGVLARRTGPIGRLVRWAQRNSALATATAVLFIVITTGLFFSTWQWQRAENNFALAVEQRLEAERHMARVERVIDGMLTDVARVLQYVPGMESLRERLLHQAVTLQTELAQEKSVDDRTRFRTAQALRRLTKLQSWLGEYEEARAAGTRSLEILDGMRKGEIPPAELKREQAEACLDLCLPYYQLNEFDSGEALATRAVRALKPDDLEPGTADMYRTLARAYRTRGMMLQRLNRNDEALADFLSAERAFGKLPTEQALDPESISTWYRTLNSLGVMYKSMQRFEEAETYYLKSIEINESAITAFPERIDFQFDLAVTALNFGNYLFRMDNLEGAVESYIACTDTTRQLVLEFPKVDRFRSMYVYGQLGLGAAYRRLTRTDDAIAAYHSALDTVQSIQSESGATPDQLKHLARIYNNLGLAHRDLGQFETAVTFHRRGIGILEQIVSASPDEITAHLSLSIGYGNLGLLLLDHGEPGEAFSELMAGLEIAESCLEINSAQDGVVDNLRWHNEKLCLACCQLNDHEGARRFASRMASLATTAAHDIAVAELIADCVSHIQPAGPTDAASASICSPYVEIAIRALKQAAARENTRVETVLHSTDLEALEPFPAFKALSKE